MFTPINFLIATATIVVLMLLHETAHYVSARMMNLRVIDFGLKMRGAVPYPFVEVGWTPNARKRLIYLMAGVATTASLFSLSLITSASWLIPGIYLGFAGQLVLETNPVFSDFVILQGMNSGKGKSDNDRMFTGPWYVHFALWVLLIVLLLSPRFLPGLLFAGA
ncbi:hypothetical protein FUA23_18660 [Neolewinella aurantiaca]|uniref:Peptidase M50 n=1 Tax=Neolewinella aurantiaca TaxID=2602767 RepID=A0A5C7FQY4_9BACT|nr:hypothetical protein [Neolewinella aurantiaca]TXF87115.1 hypothetical protein FUA23_18660 [Neolewinella aurantiaca]